jgi:hypothetical protein
MILESVGKKNGKLEVPLLIYLPRHPDPGRVSAEIFLAGYDEFFLAHLDPKRSALSPRTKQHCRSSDNIQPSPLSDKLAISAEYEILPCCHSHVRSRSHCNTVVGKYVICKPQLEFNADEYHPLLLVFMPSNQSVVFTCRHAKDEVVRQVS